MKKPTIADLSKRITELESELKIRKQKETRSTYIKCEACYKMKPPRGFQVFKVGPCGLTNYYRDEWYCAACSKKYSSK